MCKLRLEWLYVCLVKMYRTPLKMCFITCTTGLAGTNATKIPSKTLWCYAFTKKYNVLHKMISIPTVCRVIYVPKHLPTYLPPYNSKIDTKKAKKFIKTSHLEWDSLCCIHSRHWMLSSISIGQHGAGL